MTSDPAPESLLVLLVEDTEDDVLLALRALKSQGLANVVVARDGAEALDFLFCQGAYADRDPRKQPRLILLDINLPKVGGMEVLRRLRRAEETRLLRVVMLTSSAAERDVMESYAGGANSYLRKSVDSGEFKDMLQQASTYWLRWNVPPTPDAGLAA